MQIEGTKIAAIALGKLRVAMENAADVEVYSQHVTAMDAVRRNNLAALELISLMAPEKHIGAATSAPDIDGFNDVSP